MERINPGDPIIIEPILIIADPFVPPDERLQESARENYWKDSEGNWRKEIIEKTWQIQRGQY